MAQEDKSPSHHGVDDTGGVSYPNETMRVLIERASCRSFADKKIPPDVLNLILEAGNRAATGGNLQPYSIIKVENDDTKRTLARLCEDQDFIITAPVNLIFCIDFHRLRRWAELESAPFSATDSFRHFWISFQDTIIAAQNICTAADSMGLGSVYVGTTIDCPRELKQLLALPDSVFPVVLLSLGYPKVRPSPRKKLGIKTLVHDEKYHVPSDKDLLAAFNTQYPDWKKEITEDRMEMFEMVCRTVHGESFAQCCLDAIRQKGYINAVQNYFGLHYRADLMPQGTEEYLKIMEECGFGWFGKPGT
jgi:nitroreductase